MRKKIFYFTGSGNSLIIARDIAASIEADLISITSIFDGELINPDADLIGIVFPVYFSNFGGIPFVVKRFLKSLTNISSSYIFGICNHAGGPGDTLINLQKLLKSRNGELSAGFEIKMSIPYSVIQKLKKMITGKTIDSRKAIKKDFEEQQELYDNWKSYKNEIIDIISNRETNCIDSPHRIRKIFSHIFNKLSESMFLSRYKALAKINGEEDYEFEDLVNMADKSFEIIDVKCQSCGICAKICPVNNITIVNQKPVWLHRCENCYACYVWCPNNAISGEIIEFNKKYHHPEVKVSEMIRT